MSSNETSGISDVFDPWARTISVTGGGRHLMVRDRLIWARREHPDLSVKTELLALENDMAVFKAEVCYPHPEAMNWPTGSMDAQVCGTGHGTETAQGFRDYVEKAETVAIGRALWTLGYGTADAHEEEGGKLPDTPVATPQSQRVRPAVPIIQGTEAITEKQLRYAWTLARTLWGNNADQELHARIEHLFRKESSKDLTKQEASQLIEMLTQSTERTNPSLPTSRITTQQVQDILAVRDSMGWSADKVRELMKEITQEENTGRLTQEEAAQLLNLMRAEMDMDLQEGMPRGPFPIEYVV
jgi:hypothetical protein